MVTEPEIGKVDEACTRTSFVTTIPVSWLVIKIELTGFNTVIDDSKLEIFTEVTGFRIVIPVN